MIVEERWSPLLPHGRCVRAPPAGWRLACDACGASRCLPLDWTPGSYYPRGLLAGLTLFGEFARLHAKCGIR